MVPGSPRLTRGKQGGFPRLSAAMRREYAVRGYPFGEYAVFPGILRGYIPYRQGMQAHARQGRVTT